MKDLFTPEAILTDVSSGKINKSLATNLLLSLIEKSNNPELRKESILALQKLGISKENLEIIYNTIENCLLSDENTFVRDAAAVLISEKLLKYGKDALGWTIQNDSSPIVIKSLIEIFMRSNNNISKELTSYLRDWLSNYADKLGIVLQEAPFFLDIECLFAKKIKNYEISEDSFNYFRYLTICGSPMQFISINNRRVEALHFNFYNWFYLKKNQDVIESFTKIKDLASFLLLHKRYDLKFNDPITLPPSIGLLKCLKKLNLSSNGINTIPNFIFSLSNLQELDLSKNSIEKISDSFLKLKRLRVLNLKDNLLHNIGPKLDNYFSSLDEFQH